MLCIYIYYLIVTLIIIIYLFIRVYTFKHTLEICTSIINISMF